ncbi:hypothetical protein [Moritella viscosa]|uniref:Uncharacterized protein n=1 Tax=Moritella viscosa TaxID=80854 RepID=A0ABY1HEE5_9GAMM|nr:hypothetical protein [Moritella viscosa]SGY94126.1 Putative uncharacterized protein [Moritella viscosa]SGZ05696.1 Putative uncharacterized protein [Moritella viscosa]SHO26804.1 Putative uncharacterized protein [Moritella viscosa]
MSAKKALKKLKKQSNKIEKKSLKQLHKLSKMTSQSAANNSEWHHEIKDLSQDVITSMMSELKTPLEPVISWFKESSNHVEYNKDVIASGQILTLAQHQQRTATRSVLNIPLKSPACKKCPARANGICKCAAKKFKNS